MSIAPWFVDWWILSAAKAGETVNLRALLLEQVAEARRSSFDYYAFVRNAYIQSRNGLVNDNAEGTSIDAEDLYHPEMTEPPPTGGQIP
jgi:ABC-type transporter lipoprotein component MlaA